MDTVNLIIIVAAAILIAVAILITWLVMRTRQVKACNALENELIAAKAALENAEKLRKLQQESFDQQLELVKSQLSAQTEKLLQQREEALQKKAEETFKNIAGPLGKDLKEARAKAYEATEWISFRNKYMRHDIGKAIEEYYG